MTTLPYEALHARARTNQDDIIMVDDPWVPELAERGVLTPIDRIEVDGHRLDLPSDPARHEVSRLPDLFIASMRQAAEWHGRVYALPIVGNVELFLLSTKAPESVRKLILGRDATDPEILPHLLSIYQELRPSTGRFGLRGETPNDVIDVYWQLLRAFGYVDKVDDHGVVVIDSCASEAATNWLRAMAPLGGPEGKTNGVTSITEGITKSEAYGATIAWPYWIAGKAGTAPGLSVRPVARSPLMGLWMLGISTKSKHPDEAIRYISRLATEQAYQSSLARFGSIPVIDQFSNASDLQQSNEFWVNNYGFVSRALRTSVPRPRTPHWWDIEQDLGKRISAYVFDGQDLELSDNPPLYRFNRTCPLKSPRR